MSEDDFLGDDLPSRFGPKRFHSYTTHADFMDFSHTSYFRKPNKGMGSFPMKRRFEHDETHSPGPSYNTTGGHESKTLGKFSGGTPSKTRGSFINIPHDVGPGQYHEHDSWKSNQSHSAVPSPSKERRFRNVTQEQLQRNPGPYMLPYLRPNPIGCRIGPPPEKRTMKHSKSLPNMAKQLKERKIAVEEKAAANARRVARLNNSSTWRGRTDKVFLGGKLAKKQKGAEGPGPAYYPNTSCFSPNKSPSKSRKWRG